MVEGNETKRNQKPRTHTDAWTQHFMAVGSSEGAGLQAFVLHNNVRYNARCNNMNQSGNRESQAYKSCMSTFTATKK